MDTPGTPTSTPVSESVLDTYMNSLNSSISNKKDNTAELRYYLYRLGQRVSELDLFCQDVLKDLKPQIVEAFQRGEKSAQIYISSINGRNVIGKEFSGAVLEFPSKHSRLLESLWINENEDPDGDRHILMDYLSSSLGLHVTLIQKDDPKELKIFIREDLDISELSESFSSTADDDE